MQPEVEVSVGKWNIIKHSLSILCHITICIPQLKYYVSLMRKQIFSQQIHFDVCFCIKVIHILLWNIVPHDFI